MLLYLGNTVPRPMVRTRIGLTLLLTTLVPAILIFSGDASAQGLSVDPKAAYGKQPKLDVAPNSVPIINITTPNSKGLSHNIFTDYNVNKKGVILNNYNGETGRSILGGYIPGNVNLKGGSANVILNEVTSTRRSVLLGYTEVFGQQADVIVANPNGITCNGCGFLNTPRVTLTTGRPNIAPNGSLTSFDVLKGDIHFGRGGANLNNVDLFDIVSRRITLDGPVYGRTIRVRAGKNRYNYATGAVTKLPGGDSSTAAIDSTVFGGMYADRISIISTDKGAGVRMRGDVAANSGDLSITADGRIALGKVSSRRNVTIRSSRRVSAKRISAAKRATVTADLGVTIDTISSDQTTTLKSAAGNVVATTVTTLGSAILTGASGIAVGEMTTGGDLTATSTSGSILLTHATSFGQVTVNAIANKVNIGTLISFNNATIHAGKELVVTGNVLAQQNIDVDADAIFASRLVSGLDVMATLAAADKNVVLGVPSTLTLAARTGPAVLDEVISSKNVLVSSEGALRVLIARGENVVLHGPNLQDWKRAKSMPPIKPILERVATSYWVRSKAITAWSHLPGMEARLPQTG